MREGLGVRGEVGECLMLSDQMLNGWVRGEESGGLPRAAKLLSQPTFSFRALLLRPGMGQGNVRR
mgnify:CR=1 FL=1